MKPQLEYVDPTTLEVHPVLNGFPDLAPDEEAALEASIAAQGIQTELRGVPTREGGIAIYSGRHRRKLAIKLGIPTVPVLVNGIDPKKLMEFVIDEVTTGRQLTKSGLVLLLFEKHPALARSAKERIKKGKKAPCDSITGSVSELSYTVIAERYKVPREYFSLLAKIRYGASDGALKLPAASAEDWEEIRRQIIEHQTPITRIFAGWNGKVATKATKRAPVDYYSTCRTGLTSIREAFKHWKKVPVQKRAEIIGLWEEIKGLLPEDLQ